MVREYFIRRNRLINALSTHKNYLVSGRYRVLRNIAYLSYCKEAKLFASTISKSTISGLQSKLTSIGKDLIDRTYTIDINGYENTFGGSLILLTWNHNIKIFDFRSYHVLTLCNCNKEYERIKYTYKLTSTLFPVPVIHMFNDENQSYKESLVKYIPHSNWNEELKKAAISTVFSTYINYYNQYKKKTVPIHSHLDSIAINSYPFTRKLANLLQGKHSTVFPIHGDLWFENLLYDGNSFYFIDWEYYGDHCFFSDIINIFFAEALIRNNLSYLKKFLDGEYDEDFERLFHSVDENYLLYSKKELFALYLLERFSKKDANKHPNQQKELLKKYENIWIQL